VASDSRTGGCPEELFGGRVFFTTVEHAQLALFLLDRFEVLALERGTGLLGREFDVDIHTPPDFRPDLLVEAEDIVIALLCVCVVLER
jgi:hypothetical protein